MRTKLSIASAALAVFAVACSSSTTPSSKSAEKSPSTTLPAFGPGSDYHPSYVATEFSANVTNPWFPLKVGTTLVYTGTKDGEPVKNLFQATADTKVVSGVTCRVVFDRLFSRGKLIESTHDYYAQDSAGNVWYFGEDTAEYENGKIVSTEGTWHAGVNGAQPGVFMQADPTLGRMFRQEYLAGHAEDTFKVLSVTASIKVPYGDYSGAMRTEERTELEPAVVDNKYYVKDIGEVREGAVKGGNEALVLTDVTTS